MAVSMSGASRMAANSGIRSSGPEASWTAGSSPLPPDQRATGEPHVRHAGTASSGTFIETDDRVCRGQQPAELTGAVHGLGTDRRLWEMATVRTVPVGTVVIDALAAHLATYPSTGDALFTDELGKSLTYRRWKRLLSDATKVPEVDLTSHSFRHFAASALISGGASVKQVQTFLGHTSAVITLRTYAHLWPGDEDRTRNVLDAALGPLGALADSMRTEAASKQ